MELNGTLKIYTITRTAPNNYSVTATETVELVKQIENHNDDGTVNTTVRRQVTGMVVTGTSTNPVVYVSSSDYRIGGGISQNSNDVNLDTNSGVVSRLTKNGSWSKLDLVRGFPRSEENHSPNGLMFDSSANMLYLTIGGNTNGGSPANAFAHLCEYALSNTILTIDLSMLDTMDIKVDTSSGANFLYDLPTVDDPTRSNANGVDHPDSLNYDGVDLHDPFGGNDGLNQARLEENTPVQIYATGFRNMYDLVMTSMGYMYGWDNGPNAPLWGGYPANEGYGTATNNYVSSEPGSLTMNDMDCLHKVDSSGYYGGHPNPVRGNPDGAGLYTRAGSVGTWRTQYLENDPDSSLPYDWPPVPESWSNPIEGDFQIAGSQNSYIAKIFKKSMNGICEYTASNFDGMMIGDLLTTAFNTFENSQLYRINLNEEGTVDHPDSVTIIASGLLGGALDVCTIGDSPPYPGSIWIVTHASGGYIYILEPSDFFVCTGADNNSIDEDSDGYTNADEYDNGTNPCNGADRPSDFDGTLISGFKVSNLNDPDDDDDSIPDTQDFFVWDADNGLTTTIPLEYPLLNADPGFGFYGLGFTGLMANGQTDYLDLWIDQQDSSNIIAGGAAGLFSINNIDQGDALDAFDNQHNAFQFGFDVDSTDVPFVAEAQIYGPVFPDTIQDFQSVGIYIGTGDQDNYVKVVINANGGTPGIAVVKEYNGTSTSSQHVISNIEDEATVRLALVVNPANGFMRAQYAIGSNELTDLGDGFYAQGPLLNALKGPQAIAMGVISTARGSTNQFEATWSHISIRHDPQSSGHWYTLHNGTSCQNSGGGPCPYPRHEAAYVQSGDKFYLLGGREQSSNVNIYDPVTETWSIGANAPGNSLHHFQAVDYHGLILAVCGFTGSWPEEAPTTYIRVYNPVTNTWHTGPSIPVERRRGSAGVVMQNDTMYVVGGITNGHLSGTVKWTDRYAMRTAQWSTLPDAPNARDHFHAAINDDKIYAAAGRRTILINQFLDTEPTVDRFNILTNSWDTISAQIPTQRAGNTVAVLNNELIVIGGERESGNAKKASQALDLTDLTWRTLDSLNTGRHGTQAIVNNGGIYVASGATMQGGSNLTRSTEAFYFFGETTPILTPTDPSELTADNLAFGEVPIQESAELDLIVRNTNGNQAILLKNMTMFDSTVFVLDTTLSFPRFLKPGDSLRLPVIFSPVLMQAYADTLYFQHSISNAAKKIVLSGTGGFNWLGANRAYVDIDASGNGLGNSWQNAFTSVTEALNVAGEYPEITEVWIAEGTYHPANMRTASFVMRDSLTLYGGFDGTEILLSQRDVDDFPVVLSGDIGNMDDSTDNVYHVILRTATADTATIDGITIEAGQADGVAELDQSGAGLLNMGMLIVRNTIIRNCVSIGPGSALVNTGLSSYLILENVAFQNNSDPHLRNIEDANLIWRGEMNLLQE